jgi:hypothetical protein
VRPKLGICGYSPASGFLTKASDMPFDWGLLRAKQGVRLSAWANSLVSRAV